jgi:hypothetical protein
MVPTAQRRALFLIAQHPNIVARGLPTDEAVRSFWVAHPASFCLPAQAGKGAAGFR